MRICAAERKERASDSMIARGAAELATLASRQVSESAGPILSWSRCSALEGGATAQTHKRKFILTPFSRVL